MSEPITDLETAVRELGALPMPGGTEADQLRAQIVALQEAVAKAEREAARARRERDIIRERVSEPYGCRYCGEKQAHHGRQYLGGVGMHSWEKPTDEQVKGRMLARRAARMPLGLEGLCAEVAALRAERHSTNEVLDDVVRELRWSRPRTAVQRPVEDDVTPQVLNLLAGQRAVVEDPHDSPLHHSYRTGRDLPQIGGAQ